MMKDVLQKTHRAIIALIPYLVVVAVAVYFFRDVGAVTEESTVYSVPQEWNRTIERLGIQPLYPPQEDFQVGDVFAVVLSLDSRSHRWSDRSIILGHVDLKSDILKQQALRPRVQQLPVDGPGHWKLDSGHAEAVFLSSIMFPGFTGSAEDSLNADYFVPAARAAGMSRSSLAQSIRISNAMTYGAGQTIALARLMGFCDDTQMCGRAFLERLFRHQFGSEIALEGEGIVLDMAVRIVTRVFLSDEITVGSTTLNAASASAGPGQGSSDGAANPGIAAAASRQQQIEHDRKTSKPLVFGFHSIGIGVN